PLPLLHEGQRIHVLLSTDRAEVMHIGHHHVASVPQELDYASELGTRKVVRFEEHRRREPTIGATALQVWNKLADQAGRSDRGVDSEDGPRQEDLKPGVPGLRVANHDDVLNGELADRHDGRIAFWDRSLRSGQSLQPACETDLHRSRVPAVSSPASSTT